MKKVKSRIENISQACTFIYSLIYSLLGNLYLEEVEKYCK